MFTGIIETTGIVKEVIIKGSGKSFWIQSPLAPELKKDQSLSHDGVCLTVEEIREGLEYKVTAIAETLSKTNLDHWQEGSWINLERCLQLNDRLDGHIVQGHVDCTGTCTAIKERNGSWEMEISFPKNFAPLIVEKGSICLNGISLTVFNVRRKKFTVAIIPYTYEHTNIQRLELNDEVNLEFDLVGKYLARSLSLKD